MRTCGFILTIAILLGLIAATVGMAQSEGINAQEIRALNELSEMMTGRIIWMSNRDGDWEVYSMEIGNGSIRKLTDNDVPDRNARMSADGKLIAWTHGADRDENVWLMNADGSDKRMIAPNAVMGIWHSDRELVIHRDKNLASSFLYDIATGKEKKIWPLENVKLQAKDMQGAEPSPDGKLLVGWGAEPRGSWVFSSDGKFQKHIHGGCEVRFAPDGSFIYWVMTAGIFGKANIKGEVQEPLYNIGNVPYGHTYFPNLSRDMKYLIFGACPNDQHNHDTSDYEIFLMKMENLKPAWEKPMRLTFDPATDRWADIFIQSDDTPPDPPAYVEAKTQGQAVSLSWIEAQDNETAVMWYKIYRITQKDNEQLIARVKGSTYVDNLTAVGETYQYSVSAVNAAGLESMKSNSASVKTADSEPMTPTSLYATPAGDKTIRVRWASNPELDMKGYNIYRSQKSNGRYEKLNSEIITEPVYMDRSVEDEKTYYYKVSAIDNSGNTSHRSETVSCKPEKRVSDGLVALYLFDEGEGDVVHDRSRVDPPLNLNIKDKSKVSWLKGTNGVEFTGASMIVSDGSADKLLKDFHFREQISIEVWFSPANLSQNGPARIVSMSKDPGQRNFTIGQSGKELAIRLRTAGTDNNGMPEMNTNKSALPQKPDHVLVTYDGSVKNLYINGTLYSDSQKLTGDLSNWENYPLIIGNELTSDRTWLGKVYRVAIYNRSLSADEVLSNYNAGI